MPFQTSCPCGASFLANDELAGLQANCPTCQKTFVVQPPNQHTPAPLELGPLAVEPTNAPVALGSGQPLGQTYGAAPRKRKQGGATVWIIVAAAGAVVLLLVAGIVIALVMSGSNETTVVGRPDAEPVHASGKPPAVDPTVAGAVQDALALPSNIYPDIPLPANYTITQIRTDEFGDPVVVLEVEQSAPNLLLWYTTESPKHGWRQWASTDNVDGGGTGAYAKFNKGQHFHVQVEPSDSGADLYLTYRGPGVTAPAQLSARAASVQAFYDVVINGQKRIVKAHVELDGEFSRLHNGKYSDTSSLKQFAAKRHTEAAQLRVAVGLLKVPNVEGSQEIYDTYVASLSAYEETLSERVPRIIAAAEKPNLSVGEKHMAAAKPKQASLKAVFPLNTKFAEQRRLFVLKHGLKDDPWPGTFR